MRLEFVGRQTFGLVPTSDSRLGPVVALRLARLYRRLVICFAEGRGKGTVYELRTQVELTTFYRFALEHPDIWAALEKQRLEHVEHGSGTIVEFVSSPSKASASILSVRFDRPGWATSARGLMYLTLPFLFENKRLKYLSVPQNLIEPFRAFSAQAQEAASILRDVVVPTQARKEDWCAFENVVNSWGIKYLYHFTDSRNLESIREHGGLYSWSTCEQRGIEIPAPGSSRDSRWRDRSRNLQDYVRLSFNRLHPMRHVAREEGRVKDIRILVIDPSVIYLDPTLFSDINANDGEARIGGDIGSFKQIRFDIALGRWNGEWEKKRFQAEVLVKSHVPLHLMKIIKNRQ